MSNWDGAAEEASTIQMLIDANVAGGNVDTIEPPTGAVNTPAVYVLWGMPYATTRDRTIMGEEQQPQGVAVTIIAVGPNKQVASAVQRHVVNTLLGKQATANITPFKLDGGFSQPRVDSQNKPLRYEQVSFWRAILNQQPVMGDIL